MNSKLIVILCACAALLYLFNINSVTPQEPVDNGFSSLNINQVQQSNLANEGAKVNRLTDKHRKPIHANGFSYVQRPSSKLTGLLSDHIDNLHQRFIEGELSAGYVLSNNLRYCWYAPDSQESYQQALSLANENNESTTFITKLIDRYEFCQGMTKEQRRSFYSYLAQAAQGGYVPAQEKIANITAEFYMQSQGLQVLARNEYIEERDAFKQLKLALLEQAAENGSIRALNSLANMHNSQNYGDNGLLKAFAYNNTILEITDDNELYTRYQWFQQRLTQRLTPEEIAQATVQSEQILAKIYANGTIYRYKDN